jgi:enediyne biosynthesis protein E4
MKIFLLITASLILINRVFSQGTFTKITDPNNPISSYTNTGGYRGAAWVDVNNDGWIDLYAVPNHLFKNLGNGNFDLVTNSVYPGTSLATAPISCSFADFNNDGNIDLFLTSYKSGIYLNDGQGNFTSDASAFETVNNYPGWAGCLGDVNNDGKMDAVIAYANGFLPGTTPTPSLFFKQNDEGKLVSVNGYAFTNTLAPYTVPYWCDFDLDGDMDLFIASGPAGTPGLDYCYKNMEKETGKDTLIRITDLGFAKDMQDGQCYNFIDYDNDGDLDLCLTNYKGAPTRFYKNNNGVYAQVTMPFTKAESDLGNTWADFDNDGDLDVVISSDGTGNVHYYRNDGNDVFTEVPFAFSSLQQASSIAAGDYDNDGDEDLFIMSKSTAVGLYRNDGLGGTNHWLTITCEGTVSNKSAIGTRVRMKCTINGKPTWQMREISAMNNFMGENDLRVHFGMGNATVIDSLQLFYLGGDTETFTNVSPDQFYKQVEGSGALQTITSIHDPAALSKNAIQLFPNPAQNDLRVKMNNVKTDGKINCIIINSTGSVVLSKQFQVFSDSFDIETMKLEKGLYILQLSGKDIHYKGKFEKL